MPIQIIVSVPRALENTVALTHRKKLPRIRIDPSTAHHHEVPVTIVEDTLNGRGIARIQIVMADFPTTQLRIRRVPQDAFEYEEPTAKTVDTFDAILTLSPTLTTVGRINL